MPELTVFGAATLSEGKTQTFSLAETPAREGFVVRHEGRLLAYVNECPHWGVELDLGDGHFFDEELKRVYCKNHGALFVLPSGACETGPCMGRSLLRLSLRVDGQNVVVKS